MTEIAPDGAGAQAADRPRRVVVVDDSRTVRALIRAALSEDPRLVVVGEAGDPYEARDVIKAVNPDVITLDVEMPRMNGLEFLEKLMRLRPMPVVMVSNRTKEHSADAIHALSIGAVDCADVARLTADPTQRRRLAVTVHNASLASVRTRLPGAAPRSTSSPGAPYGWNGRIVLIGSSTGGVDALEHVLAGFPGDGPPVLIAQHMPEAFLTSFARRLDSLVEPRVAVAAAGDRVERGAVLLAPGGTRHLELAGRTAPRVETPETDGHDLYVPSVERLFRSAVPLAERLVPVMLTGMGRDGARAMAELRHAGAHTVVQSGETCVVDGMPRAAREAGAAEAVVPLSDIAEVVLAHCRGGETGR
jgi:two-component system chemotaxis response regulator CheB